MSSQQNTELLAALHTELKTFNDRIAQIIAIHGGTSNSSSSNTSSENARIADALRKEVLDVVNTMPSVAVPTSNLNIASSTVSNQYHQHVPIAPSSLRTKSHPPTALQYFSQTYLPLLTAQYPSLSSRDLTKLLHDRWLQVGQDERRKYLVMEYEGRKREKEKKMRKKRVVQQQQQEQQEQEQQQQEKAVLSLKQRKRKVMSQTQPSTDVQPSQVKKRKRTIGTASETAAAATSQSTSKSKSSAASVAASSRSRQLQVRPAAASSSPDTSPSSTPSPLSHLSKSLVAIHEESQQEKDDAAHTVTLSAMDESSTAILKHLQKQQQQQQQTHSSPQRQSHEQQEIHHHLPQLPPSHQTHAPPSFSPSQQQQQQHRQQQVSPSPPIPAANTIASISTSAAMAAALTQTPTPSPPSFQPRSLFSHHLHHQQQQYPSLMHHQPQSLPIHAHLTSPFASPPQGYRSDYVMQIAGGQDVTTLQSSPLMNGNSLFSSSQHHAHAAAGVRSSSPHPSSHHHPMHSPTLPSYLLSSPGPSLSSIMQHHQHHQHAMSMPQSSLATPIHSVLNTNMSSTDRDRDRDRNEREGEALLRRSSFSFPPSGINPFDFIYNPDVSEPLSTIQLSHLQDSTPAAAASSSSSYLRSNHNTTAAPTMPRPTSLVLATSPDMHSRDFGLNSSSMPGLLMMPLSAHLQASSAAAAARASSPSASKSPPSATRSPVAASSSGQQLRMLALDTVMHAAATTSSPPSADPSPTAAQSSQHDQSMILPPSYVRQQHASSDSYLNYPSHDLITPTKQRRSSIVMFGLGSAHVPDSAASEFATTQNGVIRPRPRVPHVLVRSASDRY